MTSDKGLMEWGWGRMVAKKGEKKKPTTEAALADINIQIGNLSKRRRVLEKKLEEWTAMALKCKRDNKLREAAAAMQMRKFIGGRLNIIAEIKLLMQQRKVQLEGGQSMPLGELAKFDDLFAALNAGCAGSFHDSIEEIQQMLKDVEASSHF